MLVQVAQTVLVNMLYHGSQIMIGFDKDNFAASIKYSQLQR